MWPTIVVAGIGGATVGVLIAYTQRLRARVRLLTNPEKPEQYEIGGKTFYPVKVTKPVMEKVIDAQYRPEPDENVQGFPFALMGMTVQPKKEDQIGYMNAAYQQVSILLMDSENKHPDMDFLGVYLDIAEAQKIIEEVMP